MPNTVEQAQQQSSESARNKPRPTLGARAVVELLRVNVPETLPAQFKVQDHRDPEALQQLIALLTLFQRRMARSPYANASVLSLITNHLVGQGQQLVVARPDLGAICLVDSLFDQLLNSERFDKEAWQLVAMSRFPITKFALQDFSFFFATQNIGRRLLNTMTLHLLGSAAQSKGEIRTAISLFVDRLNLEYIDHISQFNSVCIETQSLFASNQRRLHKVETKVSQLEAPDKKKDRSEPIVIETLNSEVGGRDLPDMIVDFIYGEWRNAMRLVLRQQGEKSPDWKRQVSLTQSMVKMYDTCLSEEGRLQYQRFWPSMFKGIKALLISVEQGSDAFDQAIDPLELVCTAMISGAMPDLKTAPVLESRSVVDQSFEVLPVDEKYLEQVESLQVGEWIRIRTPSGDHEACKLTLKKEGAEPWVFVNNTGNKVAKKNKYVLAKGLKDGVVELVGKGQWIDDLLRESFDSLARQLEAVKQTTEEKSDQNRPSSQAGVTGPDGDASETPVSPQSPDKGVSEEEVTKESPAAEREEASSSISLVSMEDQASSYHTHDSSRTERTEDILSGSTLAIASDKEAAPQTEREGGEDNPAWEDYFKEEVALTEAEMNAALKAVQALEVGALVDYLIDGKQERCKLAVKMQARDKYIFVNRVGIKVWDTSEKQVAEAVAKGLVTIIDSGVKFDRALERVVKNIQSDKKGRE